MCKYRYFRLQKNLLTPFDIEVAIRIIKKIMRTPIKMNDNMKENLPKYIVQALGKGDYFDLL